MTTDIRRTSPDRARPVVIEYTGMQKMASVMWRPFLIMGAMIVIISFLVGIYNSGIAAGYFSFSKAEREAAEAGTQLVGQKVTVEAIKAWLPGFKFLGMGMLLGGITFLLATILGELRVAGGKVQQALGKDVVMLTPPLTAQLFPPIMMMGEMLLVAVFILSLILAGDTASYWNRSIAKELDVATTGSALLAQLARIEAMKVWLEPLKFVGIAFLLTGIGLALATIVQVLRFQTKRVLELLG